jgi:hypothetical protein
MISTEGSKKPRGQIKISELYVFMTDYSLESGGAKIFGPGLGPGPASLVTLLIFPRNSFYVYV